jgi:hypothetical protein
MKNIFRITTVLVLIAALFSACEKWIDPNLNVDPDRPLDVDLALILPSVQANMAYNMCGNDVVRVTSILMQYLDGVGRQSLAQGHYNINNSDPNNLWNNAYASVMYDCVTIIKKGEETESPHWTAVGKILLAFEIGAVTDLWGNVPYSEAFLGVAQFHPSFDSQESIYTEILSLLDEAITELDQDNPIPIEGDLMFGGDAVLWQKAAQALKARYLMHTVLVNSSVKSQVVTAVNASFASNDEDMQFQYGLNGSTEATPLYQFQTQRTGDITMCATLVDFLANTSDPRLPAYCALDADSLYRGSPAGVADESASQPNPEGIYWKADGISTIIGYVETQFLKAEALLGTDNNAAAEAYKEAVQASLEKHDVFDQAWFDANISVETGATINLQKILEQKWVAMFGQAEAWNDWRRSNNEIGLALAQDELLGQIPYAFPYPSDEQTYNTNCPQGRDLVRKMWWMGNANPSPTK